MKQPTNEEDEFDNQEERMEAYAKACKQIDERMRDNHGDLR